MSLLEMIIAALGETELTNEQIAENINSKLGQFMIPKGTFNELNEKYKVLNNETNGLRTTLTEKELELENIATANMTEQERLQHDLTKAQEQIAQHALTTNRLNATNKLQKAGFDETEIESLIEAYVTDDSSKTDLLIDTLVKTIGDKVSAGVKARENELLNNSTEIDGQTETSEPGDITKEQFAKFDITQRGKLFKEQPDLYNELIK